MHTKLRMFVYFFKMLGCEPNNLNSTAQRTRNLVPSRSAEKGRGSNTAKIGACLVREPLANLVSLQLACTESVPDLSVVLDILSLVCACVPSHLHTCSYSS